MTRSLVVLCGLALALLIAGFAASTIHVISQRDQLPRLAEREDYREAIIDLPSERHMDHYDAVSRTKHLVQAHAHFLNLCIFLILFCLMIGQTRFPRAWRSRLAWVFTLGLVVYPIGLALQAFHQVAPGQVLAVIGAALIIAPMLATWLGLTEYGERPARPDRSR